MTLQEQTATDVMLHNRIQRTLSISAMIGMRNRASRSRSVISPFTSDTSWALGRPVSVKIVSTRRASVSAPGGKVLSRARSLAWEEPSARISGVMSCCIVSCTLSSMPP